MFTAFSPRLSFLRPGFATAPPGVGAGGGPVVDSTIFLAGSQPSGISRLEQTLDLDGVTYPPAFVFDGGDAGVATWDSAAADATALSLIGAGTDPTLSRYTPGTDDARAVRQMAGKIYQATSSTTAGDVGTDDFVLEGVFQIGSAGSENAVASKYQSLLGWIFITSSSGRVRVYFGAAGGLTSIDSAAAYPAGTWVHALVFADRDGNARMYIDGVFSNQTSIASRAASLDTVNKLELGGYLTTSARNIGDVATVRQWRLGPAVIGSTATQDACAADRAARVMGAYPEIATGTAVPSTATRSTVAHLDRVIDEGTLERRLFPVTPNWIRFCRRAEAAGGEFLSGFLLEAQATNLVLQSETLDNASWTKSNYSVTANAIAAPNGETAADALVAATTTLGTRTLSQAVTLTAAGYILSAWVQAGSKTFAYLENATIANGRAWFNLGAGSVGTTQAGIAEALIEPYGGGWFRISVRFTGTVAAHTLHLGFSTVDAATPSNDALATVQGYAWGAQVELAVTGEPSSYITTTTATVTRTGDTLQYRTDDGNLDVATGMLSADVLHAARDLQAAHTLALISASAAAATPDSIQVAIAATDLADASMQNAGVAQYAIAGTTDVADGEKHTLATTWAANAGRLVVDGAQEGATDPSVGVLGAAPALLTVGQLNGAQAANALIGNVRIRNATT